MARTRNLGDVIRSKLAAQPGLAEGVEREEFNADIAMKVYRARTQAGLTQKQLAALIGTRQSAISRLEDADYEGHSLDVLNRIARALGHRLRVEFSRPAKLLTRTSSRPRGGRKARSRSGTSQ